MERLTADRLLLAHSANSLTRCDNRVHLARFPKDLLQRVVVPLQPENLLALRRGVRLSQQLDQVLGIRPSRLWYALNTREPIVLWRQTSERVLKTIHANVTI